VRKPRKPFHGAEEDEEDRNEPGAEHIGEPARHEHRRQGRERDAQQRKP
jgi:hypothetical protein